jgi:hypothetical protein
MHDDVQQLVTLAVTDAGGDARWLAIWATSANHTKD